VVDGRPPAAATPDPGVADLRARLAAAEERHRVAEERLADAERVLADTQRTAHVGSWAWTQPDRLEWSPEMYRIFGIDEDGFTGSLADVIARAIHPDDREAVEHSNRTVSEEGRAVPLQYRVLRPDGTVRTVWAEAGRLTFDDEGRPLTLTGVVIDITERTAAEQALHESELRWKFAVDGTRDGIWDWDVPRGSVWYSPRWKAMLGYEDHEIGDDLAEWSSRVHPDDLERTLHDVRAHLDGETPFYTNEHRMRRKDGTWVWVLDRGMVLTRDQDDAPVRMIGTHADITARIESEEALRAGEARYRSLVEGAPGIVYTYSPGVGATYYSARVTEILGYPPEAFTGEDNLWVSLIHPDDRGVVEAAAEAAMAQQPFSASYRMRDAGGAWHWMEDRCIAYRQTDGRLYVEGFALDVTDRHTAEVERERLIEQLAESRRLEAIGRLAGGVAHDFNNMLGAILGHTELALDALDPADPVHADLEEVRSAARRSADLTRQLLAFARKQVAAPRVVDVNAHVASLLAMLRRLIGEDIDLRWLPGAGLPPILIDTSQLDQVLANLSVNARDAIDGVGRIEIATEVVDGGAGGVASGLPEPGRYVALRVTDDGCGMDGETVARIYEPFFTTKDIGRGTGLGLATVHGIVVQNNGRIDVESAVGSGTTFRVLFPACASPQPSPEPEAAAASEGGTETVLLVEDEPAILGLAARMLRRQGYRVLAAPSPADALRLAELHDGPIELLVTDVVMPGSNGRDLAEAVARLRPGIRELFMSGYTADVIAHHGVLDGGTAFLQKPFTPRQLASAVREVLDRGPAPGR
jgi:PAS domain S-box-containing protein